MANIRITNRFYKQLQDVKEEFEENMLEDMEDVFIDTKDSYANEMLQQHIQDIFDKEAFEELKVINSGHLKIEGNVFEEIKDMFIKAILNDKELKKEFIVENKFINTQSINKLINSTLGNIGLEIYRECTDNLYKNNEKTKNSLILLKAIEKDDFEIINKYLGELKEYGKKIGNQELVAKCNKFISEINKTEDRIIIANDKNNIEFHYESRKRF